MTAWLFLITWKKLSNTSNSTVLDFHPGDIQKHLSNILWLPDFSWSLGKSWDLSQSASCSWKWSQTTTEKQIKENKWLSDLSRVGNSINSCPACSIQISMDICWLQKFSLPDLLFHNMACCEMIMHSILLLLPWTSCGVTDWESKLVWEVFHQFANESPFPHTRWATNDNRLWSISCDSFAPGHHIHIEQLGLDSHERGIYLERGLIQVSMLQ